MAMRAGTHSFAYLKALLCSEASAEPMAAIREVCTTVAKGPTGTCSAALTQPGLGGMRNSNGNGFTAGTRSESPTNNSPPLRPFVILAVGAREAETRSCKFPWQHFGSVVIRHAYALSSTGMWQSKPFWSHFTEGGN